MRILQVHKHLYRRDGASAYLLTLAELLVKHGHEVGMWGTDAERQNFQFPISNFQTNSKFQILNSKCCITEPLVQYLNFDRREGILRDLKKFGHMIWATESAEKFDALLDIFAPNIIHLHNIYHHISPSILPVAARHQIPVVMTVHDYKLINPNYSLFDHGEVCERDGLRAVAHRCIKNSYVSTLADVIEMKIHRTLQVYARYVSRFIVPTIFVKEKLVEKGLDEKKIEVVPLPIAPSPVLRTSSPAGRGIANHPSTRWRGEGYILYAGRLIQEKGIYLVLDIARQLPEIQFKIAGGGPEEEKIKNKILKIKNVELLGFLEKEKLQTLIAGARLILVPSLWYEVSPFAVLEAMAQGKVVLASKVGALTNLIEDGKTGFLIPSPVLRTSSPAGRGIANHPSPGGRGTANHPSPRGRETANHPSPRGRGEGEGQWVDKVEKIYYNEVLLKKVGQNAKAYVKRVHGMDQHYQKIMGIYEMAISKTKNQKSNTQT